MKCLQYHTLILTLQCVSTRRSFLTYLNIIRKVGQSKGNSPALYRGHGSYIVLIIQVIIPSVI